MNQKQRQKMAANVSAIVLIALINNPERKSITFGQIKNLLMGKPFNMTAQAASEGIKVMHGLKFKGEGDDATISRISLPSFASEKKVLPFDLEIRPFFPNEVFEKIKEEDALVRKVGLIVGLMDHMGIWIYQAQLPGIMKALGVKKSPDIVTDPLVQAISNAVTQKDWVTKPFEKKGVNVVLASGKKAYDGLAEVIKLYDAILMKRLREAQPEKDKSRPETIQVTGGAVTIAATIEHRHITIDIVTGDKNADTVVELARNFLGSLLQVH